MANACLKTTFIGVSVLSAICAIALVGGGVWYSLKLQEITSLRNLESVQMDFNVYWPQVIPYVFVGVGIFGLLVAFCGFCGSGGSKPCLITYNICTVIVIIAMVGAGIAAILVAAQKSDEFIKDTFHNVFQEAVIVDKVRKKFSEIESSLHCCGADGPRNYMTAQIPYPASCCDGGTNCGLSLNPRRGCIQVLSMYSKWAFYAGTAGCGAISILAIISMCLSIALIRRTNSKVLS